MVPTCRDIFAGALHKPTVTSLVHFAACRLLVCKCLHSGHQEGFLFAEDVNALDGPSCQRLSRRKEEGHACLRVAKLALAELWLAVAVDGVEHRAVLEVGEVHNADALRHLLVDVADVGGALGVCDEPGLSCLTCRRSSQEK